MDDVCMFVSMLPVYMLVKQEVMEWLMINDSEANMKSF